MRQRFPVSTTVAGQIQPVRMSQRTFAMQIAFVNWHLLTASKPNLLQPQHLASMTANRVRTMRASYVHPIAIAVPRNMPASRADTPTINPE